MTDDNLLKFLTGKVLHRREVEQPQTQPVKEDVVPSLNTSGTSPKDTPIRVPDKNSEGSNGNQS